LLLDKGFKVNAEIRELFFDDDQESVKCLGGDVRPETDHTSEALSPVA